MGILLSGYWQQVPPPVHDAGLDRGAPPAAGAGLGAQQGAAVGGAAAEVAPAPGLHTPGGEPGAAALEPSLLRVLCLKLPSTGSTHCPISVLLSPGIPTTNHTLILLHLFLDLHLFLHSTVSDLRPGLQEGVHHPGLPQPLDPAAGARGEGCGPLPGHRARASLGHGIRSPWPWSSSPPSPGGRSW